MDFSVRRGEQSDIDAIIALVKDSWARTYDPVIGEAARREISSAKHVPGLFEKEMTERTGISCVAHDADGALIGYAGGYRNDKGYGYVDHIHVEPSWWGRGIAAALLDEAQRWMAGKASGLELTVLDGNDRALAFYLKYGFQVIAREGPESGMGGRGVLRMRIDFAV